MRTANVGRVVKDIPPGEENPRNSEGAFLGLEDGSVLFVYSRFRGTSGNDDAPSDIARAVSEDGGESWHDAGVVVGAHEHGAKNVMSVSLTRMADGDIGLFYCVRAAANDCRAHLRRSSDEAETWGEAMPCISSPGYYVTNNDRATRLSDGRLILPCAFHRNGYDSSGASGIRFDSRGTVVFFFSDDDGHSWYEADTKCSLPYSRHSGSGLQEPGVVELEDGRLWAWARTDLGRQYEMFSFDRGDSWTTVEPSGFTSPCSPMSVKAIPGTGRFLAVWNPIPDYNTRFAPSATRWSAARTPLVMSVSRDGGGTWVQPKVMEDSPDHGYCYTAIGFVDDGVLLGYCAGGGEDGGCLNRLRIRKITLREIEELG